MLIILSKMVNFLNRWAESLEDLADTMVKFNVNLPEVK